MWGRDLSNHQVGATYFTTLWLCVGGGFGEGTVPLPGLWRFSWHSPSFQSLHPLMVYACYWIPEWVDLYMLKEREDSLSRVSWKSSSFFCHPNPHWFLHLEVMGICLPSAWPLGCVVWPGSGMALSQGVPPNFYPPHVNVGPSVLLPPSPLCTTSGLLTSLPISASPLLLPVWVNVIL